MTPEQEEARLEQAMQRGDELLVNSLKNEDRRRWRMRATVAASMALVAGIAAFVIAHRPSTPPTEHNVVAVAPTTQPPPPASNAPPADTLASLSDDNWRRAFATGNRLAEMPPEKSWPLLQANWAKIPNYEARQQ